MKKSMMTSAAVVILSTLLMGGCQIVKVVDLSNNPVMGAKVDVLDSRDASKIVLPAITGFDGCALLPLPMGKEPEKLQVTKEGYPTSKVLRKKDPKVTVQMRKSPPKPTKKGLDSSNVIGLDRKK